MASDILPYAEQFLSVLDYQYLRDTAGRLEGLLEDCMREAPDHGLCHADLVLSNLRSHPERGVTFFDFGNAARTWRVLDIAVVYLSAVRTSGQDGTEVLSPMKEGYSRIRALPDDFDRMFMLMQILRWLTWIGGNAASLPLRRGIEPFAGNLLVRPVRLIREMMEQLAV